MNSYQIPEDEKEPVTFQWFDGEQGEYRSADGLVIPDWSPVVSFLSKHPDYGKDTDEQNV